ncbi:MAG TPA: PLP-dependent aminotransferase family protein [Reyranella sp.]|nr:PLP-dependent aminotransferase family protein [Reyranella sp.]
MTHTLSGLVDLDRTAPALLTRQLYERLRSAIVGGRLRPGHRLPSSRLLARELGISRNTVSAVIEQLAAEGYVDVGRGRRPSVTAGIAPALAGGASRQTPAKTRMPLSTWARHIGRSGWPFEGEGPARPFVPGLPDRRAFPHDLWGRLLRRAARNGRAPSNTVNSPALQSALARHLVDHRGVKTTPGQIIVTPSAQGAIELVSRVMLSPGDAAWLENPGYGGARVALEAAGARITGVRLDRSGLVLAGRSDKPRLIFVTPSHQYPTGRLMPVDRRLELLRFTAAAGAVLIEDDYDSEFHYDGRPVASLQGLDETECVFYVGTFSKVMTSDIRVGYVVVPEGLIKTFETAQRHSGQLVNATLQAALAEFILDGAYAAHIRRMTRVYGARRDRLIGALAAASPGAFAVDPPAGGMQLLARLRQDDDDLLLCSRLGAAGVTARPLSSHFVGRSVQRGLFLGFAAWSDEEIDAGARLIGDVVARRRRAQ